jgi:transposase InsO family protein
VTEDQREIRRKKRVIEYAEKIGHVGKACRRFGIARSTFYLWRDRYRESGDEGLTSRRRGCHHNHPNKTPEDVVEKIHRVCRRHGMRRLPNRVGRRAVHTHRYEKQVPGHHVQVDVKFLTLKRKRGGPVRRYQYTAIDDATRVRALKIYKRHTQANAIDFIDYVVEKFPFRIQTIRTDRGHEFQALFHWHVADNGMEHVYIKPRTPQLNGKVERSHRTDKDEFYQLLTYKDDVDLEKKLAVWERFYNNDRPHGAHKGKTPYEVLREKLS